jgi:hypothetical protein
MRYKLLKDLPGLRAGAIFEVLPQTEKPDPRFAQAEVQYSQDDTEPWQLDGPIGLLFKYHKANPDWFEPLDDTPTRWRAEPGGKFYSIDLDDGIQVSEYKEVGSNPNSSFTHDWELGNYFRTEQQAQAAAEAIRAVLRYMQAPGGTEYPTDDPNESYRFKIRAARKLIQENN